MATNELLLALSNMAFLTGYERGVLFEKLDNLEALTVLSIEDISLCVRRVLKTRLWQPATVRARIDNQLEIMERYRIGMVSVFSADYPPLLRELHDPPFAVFWRGELPDPERPMVAMVGTRSPSGNGAIAAERIGREFGERGIPVVSGLARGIDAFAHRGNVDAGARSVAVLACGLERLYPRSNCVLAGRLIEAGGCVLGEYPPGDEPLAFRFPQRNRIISGLSRSVVVVEAPARSGALITADFALEQGRDLFVVEATSGSIRGEGTDRLREDGALAIRGADDVVSEWGMPTSRVAAMADMQAELGFYRE